MSTLKAQLRLVFPSSFPADRIETTKKQAEDVFSRFPISIDVGVDSTNARDYRHICHARAYLAVKALADKSNRGESLNLFSPQPFGLLPHSPSVTIPLVVIPTKLYFDGVEVVCHGDNRSGTIVAGVLSLKVPLTKSGLTDGAIYRNGFSEDAYIKNLLALAISLMSGAKGSCTSADCTSNLNPQLDLFIQAASIAVRGFCNVCSDKIHHTFESLTYSSMA